MTPNPDDALDLPPLQRLLLAVQAFSNSMCDDAGDIGIVRQAVVVWDEASIEADMASTHYAALGDGATAIGTLGLLTYAKHQLIADLGLTRD